MMCCVTSSILIQRIDTDAYPALIIVPDKLRSAVLTQLYTGNEPTAAHLGVKKTYEKVKQRFYWLKIRKYVEQWCQCCEVYYIQCIIDSVYTVHVLCY